VAEITRKARDTDKRAKALGRELAEVTAARLVMDAARGCSVVSAHRDVGDMEWMMATASAVGDLDGNALLFLTCGTDGSGMFMLVGPADQVKECGPKVAALLEGRGGGKGRFQGKVSKVSKYPEAIALLEAAVAV
jgi:misacylated tRNA(Ala) deacylase